VPDPRQPPSRATGAASGSRPAQAASSFSGAVGSAPGIQAAELLIGFENHGGRTYLGPAAQPLGQALTGFGNDGDGWEGAAAGRAAGTCLRAPCLPRNPVFAGFLSRAR
jgi:CobQ-like glutamine amidotransferase family enzyme